MSWRAIFIPILVVLTIVVIVQANSGSADSTETAGTAPASGQAGTRSAAQPGGRVASRAGAAQGTPSEPATPAPGAVPDLTDKDAEGHVAASIALGALPAGADFVGDRRRDLARRAGTARRPLAPVDGTSTYTVEVEDGLQSAEAGPGVRGRGRCHAGRSPVVDRWRPGQPAPGSTPVTRTSASR